MISHSSCYTPPTLLCASLSLQSDPENLRCLIPFGKTLSRRRYTSAKQHQYRLETWQYHNEQVLKAIQLNNLKMLVEHCYKSVPYYAQLMRDHHLNPHDISTLEDLKAFPFLTKSILKQNFHSLTSKDSLSHNNNLCSSGGTTGTPVQFYRDRKNEYIIDATNWRFWRWAGYVPGMKTAVFWGNPRETRQLSKIYSRLKYFMENTFILDAFDVSEEAMASFACMINRHKPEIYRGYASAILCFARYIESENLKIHKPKSIIITADKIYQSEKSEISAVFGCRVFEEYGCRSNQHCCTRM